MRTYALIGKSLSHSFSEKYFADKFIEKNILDVEYCNLEIDDISEIKEKIINHNLLGFNVTIPYKSSIIPYLDFLDNETKKIGSVNTVKVSNGNLYGYNTDIIGFEKSLIPLLENKKTSLILGSGGASKSIQFVLKKLNIQFKIVSRRSDFDYHNITEDLIKESDIIINTTPLGTHPNINSYPEIPYKYLNSKHLLYDLVYNPELSQFLKFGKKYGTQIKNGLEMLQIQADESWKIWNSDVNLNL
mgnify:CR=1 FL=1